MISYEKISDSAKVVGSALLSPVGKRKESENHWVSTTFRLLFIGISFSRGRGARTPIYGFGDRCSTIELFPFGPAPCSRLST